MTRILALPYFHRADSPAKTHLQQGDKEVKTSHSNSMSTGHTSVTLTQKTLASKTNEHEDQALAYTLLFVNKD